MSNHDNTILFMKNIFTITNEDEMESGISEKIKSSPLSSNDLYLYSDVSRESIFVLNKELYDLERSMKILQITYRMKQPLPIYLNICTDGGEIFPALSAVDRIKSCTIPIHSIVEGSVASAGTLISVVAHRRLMRKNAFMLIHQVKGGVWGTYSEVKDENKNMELLMNIIKGIYLKHSKFKERELTNLLKGDLYLTADECLKYGLVDEII